MKSQKQSIKECEKSNNILQFILNNADPNYITSTIQIFSKVNKLFEKKDFLFDISVTTLNNKDFKKALYHNPFMFTKEGNYEKRKKLMNLFIKHHKQSLKLYKFEFLYSTGNGCIDDNCIMVCGMAPGFFSNSVEDKLSIRFKPSYFFQHTSSILRQGLYDQLNEVYFTNLSKIALSKEKIATLRYETLYNRSNECFKKELSIVKPRMIIATGNDVYNYLLLNKDKFNIKISIHKLMHPSAMLRFNKNNKQACVKIYKQEIKKNITKG